ncbi:hypothetical protein BD779DRAFT_1437435 [Infundibulicybe gibba]|nr:hypothetical protein BD779DRAFT_1437435 [Infundibulicybe gibba]
MPTSPNDSPQTNWYPAPVSDAQQNSVGEDEQLTIKIPNPKVFMARQSQWVGRRGKPRCDSCRQDNLKCDRQRPACNHCSWGAGKECKYTPLPTPAHRGIPRCDRCRLENLKCDRNLPICNFCMGSGDEPCNYTPKRRQKTSAKKRLRQTESTVHYRQHTPSISHNIHGKDHFSLPSNREDNPRHEHHRYASSAGSKTYDTHDMHDDMPPLPPITPQLPTVAAHNSDSIQHGSTSRVVSSIPSAYVEPWYNPHFAPIPEYVVRSLRVISRATVPSRTEFDETLLIFQQNVMVELRETMCFSPAVYATMSVALKNWGSESPEISDHIVRWINIHWVGSGSAKFYLILTPRLSGHPMSRSEIEESRSQFIEYYDRKWFIWTKTFPAILQDLSPKNEEHMAHFDRIPVQPQIYDLLTYAHRDHKNASEMLTEIRDIGYSGITWPMAEIYIGMCPNCGSL